MKGKLFDFLMDEKYKLMVDMSKSVINSDEIKSIEERYKNIDKKAFFDICFEHELFGVVGYYIIKHGLDLPHYWLTAYTKEKNRLDFLYRKANEIACELNKKNIPIVILKNGGIMLKLMEDPVQCPMEDIDSLVVKDDFYKAHEILVASGFNFKFRSQYEKECLDEAFRDGSTEYYILSPEREEIWFELAWRVVSGRWIRPDLEPNPNLFVAHSTLVNNGFARVLSPEENLLQVCIHTAKHSYVRAPGLRLHMDVDRIVSKEEIDWNLFVKMVCDAHVKTSSYFSLYIPSKLFGTEIPIWVLEKLRPKKAEKIEKLISKAGLIHPKADKFGRFGFLRFQTLLYDTKKDMLRVIYPSKKWIQERYNCKGFFRTSYFVFVRLLDLIGLRKKKS